MIIEHVWNISFDTTTNVVDVYINYGVGFANLVALPIAGKLRHRLRFRQILRELTLEGVVSILEGINPRMLEAKLNGFLQQATEKSPPASDPEAQRRIKTRSVAASRGAP
jgi:flagellar motor component MotA